MSFLKLLKNIKYIRIKSINRFQEFSIIHSKFNKTDSNVSKFRDIPYSQTGFQDEFKIPTTITDFNSMLNVYLQEGRLDDIKRLTDSLSTCKYEVNNETHMLVLSRYLCDIKDLGKCEQWVEEQCITKSLNLTDEDISKLVFKAIDSNVETSQIINFLKFSQNFRKDKFISKHLFESIITAFLKANVLKRKLDVVDVLKFVLKFNEKILNKLSTENENLKLQAKLSQQIKDFKIKSQDNLIESILTGFKEHFSVILAQHSCFSEVSLILNNEKLNTNSNFQVVFDTLIRTIIEAKNYKRLHEFVEFYKNPVKIPNDSCVALLKDILNRKYYQSLYDFLKLVQNSKVNFKNLFGSELLNFEDYTVDDIVKLNEFLYKNPLDSESSGRLRVLIRDEKSVYLIKKEIYSIQFGKFLASYKNFIRLNCK